MIGYFLSSLINNLPAIIFAYWSGYLCSQSIDGWGWMLIGSLLTAVTTRFYSSETKSDGSDKS